MEATREARSSRSTPQVSSQGSTPAKANEKKEGKQPKDGFDAGGGGGGAKRAERPPAPEAAPAADKAKPKDELDDPALKLTESEKDKIRAARDGVHDSERDLENPRRRKDTTAGHTEAVIAQSRSMDVEARSALLKRLAAAPLADIHNVSESLDRLTRSKAVQSAGADQQKALAAAAARADRAGLSDLSKVMASPAAEANPQVATVATQASNPGLAALRDLCLNQPAKLQVTDKDGRTTLDNLATLATQPLHAELVKAGVSRASILDSAMQEIANPGKVVDQSIYGTCQVTSCQYEIARDDPSEYVRVLAGLAGPTGQVPMRNGDALYLQTEYLTPKPGDGRSPTEIMFQSAAINYAVAPWFDYDAANDQKRFGQLIPWGQGAFETRFLSGFTGKTYDNVTLDTAPLNSLGLSFLETQRTAAPGVDPVILNIYTSPNQGGAHSVTFLEAHDGRVYFRNQWGPDMSPTGATTAQGWRVEDPASGVYSMSYEDFAKNCYGFSASREALSAWKAPEVPVVR
jgi:hypothetical protein